MYSTSLLTLGCAVFLQRMTQESRVCMCYFTNWSQYRVASGRFTPEQVDPFLCTHIIYAFAHVDAEPNRLKFTEPNDVQAYGKLIDLKQVNPNLKVMLAIGGASHDNQAFHEVATTKHRVLQFAENVARFLRHSGFDGVIVDWQFPGNESKASFQIFLQLLSLGIKTESVRTGKDKLEMGVAVAGDHSIADDVYGPKDMYLEFLDYVLLSGYDLWGPWSATLGHHSPLNVLLPGHPDQGRYSMKRLVEEWVQHKLSKNKLVLGLSTYGHTGQLDDASYHSPGDFWTKRLGTPGPMTRIAGYLAYYEICENLKNPDWSSEFNERGQVPYAWNAKTLQYVCYDDPRSFSAKAQYIVDEGLAGAMFWSMDYDDFTGQYCDDGAYPLLRRVKAVLSGAPGDQFPNVRAPDTVQGNSKVENPLQQQQHRLPEAMLTTQEPPALGDPDMPVPPTVTFPTTAENKAPGQSSFSAWTLCLWLLVILGLSKLLTKCCRCSSLFRKRIREKLF